MNSILQGMLAWVTLNRYVLKSSPVFMSDYMKGKLAAYDEISDYLNELLETTKAEATSNE